MTKPYPNISGSSVVHPLSVSLDSAISCFVSSFELLDDLLMCSRGVRNDSMVELSIDEFDELRDKVVAKYGTGPMKISDAELAELAKDTGFEYIISPILDRLSGIMRDHICADRVDKISMRKLNMIQNNKQNKWFDIWTDSLGNTIIGGDVLTFTMSN